MRWAIPAPRKAKEKNSAYINASCRKSISIFTPHFHKGGKARIDFENEKDLQLRVLKMMHASLCDADGNLTEKPEDFNAFMESVPNKVLNALVNAFSALNITGETHLKN